MIARLAFTERRLPIPQACAQHKSKSLAGRKNFSREEDCTLFAGVLQPRSNRCAGGIDLVESEGGFVDGEAAAEEL